MARWEHLDECFLHASTPSDVWGCIRERLFNQHLQMEVVLLACYSYFIALNFRPAQAYYMAAGQLLLNGRRGWAVRERRVVVGSWPLERVTRRLVSSFRQFVNDCIMWALYLVTPPEHKHSGKSWLRPSLFRGPERTHYNDKCGSRH
eukprot:scaffold142738_cov23-Prasinocladus_malaysianus.AAC.1